MFCIGPLRCLGDVGTASVVYMVFFPCLLGYCHEDVEVSIFIKLQQRFRVFEANVGNMFAMSVGQRAICRIVHIYTSTRAKTGSRSAHAIPSMLSSSCQPASQVIMLVRA